ncbi:hypothetical protein COLO4_32012 [Corchorus olitorius]|uniref:F-box domain-containing protein n=1 Tax=Corchorus olitorius TaxID=93759 RepID=A0A1R3H2S9_9ROSI|nr:hypothetical protein COLO4_32012 [Corchorus olitorius]
MAKTQFPEQDDDFGCGDMVSKLPDDILLRIFSSLPAKDIVATSAWSSRWKSFWKSCYLYDFDFELRKPRRWKPEDQEVAMCWYSVQKQVQEIPDRGRIGKFRLRCVDPRPSYVMEKRTEFSSLLSKLCNVPSLAEAHIEFGGWSDHYCLELLKRICYVKSLQLSAHNFTGLFFEYSRIDHDKVSMESVISFYYYMVLEVNGEDKQFLKVNG